MRSPICLTVTVFLLLVSFPFSMAAASGDAAAPSPLTPRFGPSAARSPLDTDQSPVAEEATPLPALTPRFAPAPRGQATIATPDPGSASADEHYQAAEALFSQGRYAEADREYTMAVEGDPQSAAYLDARGVNRYHEGRYAEALFDFDAALLLRGESADILYHRGLALMEVDALSEAIDNLTQAIVLDSGVAAYYAARADAYYYVGDGSASLYDIEKALALGGEDDDMLYVERGKVKAAMGQYAQAIDDLDTAIEMNAENAWAYFRKGEALYLDNQNAQALSQYDTAIALEGGEEVFYYGRGCAHHALAQYQSALEDFETAISLAPEDPWNHYLYAETLSAMGLPGQALVSYNRALSLEPENPLFTLSRDLILEYMLPAEERMLIDVMGG